MKKVVTIGFAARALAACGDEKQTITPSEKAPDTNEETAQQDTASKEEATEKKAGVRSNPVPLGQKHTVNQLIYDADSEEFEALVDITITEAERGDVVYQKALAINEYNDAPMEGYEYVALNVTVAVTESATEDYALNVSEYDFDFINKDGSPYEDVSIVFDPALNGEVFVGGSTTGYVIGQVKKGEEALVVYEDGNWNNIFFSIK